MDDETKITLIKLRNTLETIEVHGAQNMSSLLTCINELTKILKKGEQNATNT